MKYYTQFIVLIILFGCFSCTDDINELSDDIRSNTHEINLTSTGEHLVFNDYLDFRFKYDLIKDLEDEKQSSLFYDLGHNSLRPIVTSNTVSKYIEMLDSKTSAKNYRLSDGTTDIIADDVFAAILNEDGEVIVNDSIYKYTSVGLFICKTDKKEKLDSLMTELKNQFGSSAMRLGEPTPCIADELGGQPGEIIAIDDDINYYVDQGCGEFTGGGTGGGTSGPTLTIDERFNNYLSTLSPCEDFNGWWPLGEARKCDDFFENNVRIRTKVWNQNYIIYKSIGVEVKHEKQNLGLWTNIKADKLYLGIDNLFYVRSVDPGEALIPHGSTEQKFLVYGNQQYSMSTGVPIIGISPSNGSFNQPEGVSINYIYVPDITSINLLGNDIVKKSYVEEFIWLDVFSDIEQFLDRNNIKIEDIGAIQLTVVGKEKWSYKTINLYEVINDGKKLSNEIDGYLYIVFGWDPDKNKPKLPKIKLKNPFEDVYADFYGIGFNDNKFRGNLMSVDNLNSPF